MMTSDRIETKKQLIEKLEQLLKDVKDDKVFAIFLGWIDTVNGGDYRIKSIGFLETDEMSISSFEIIILQVLSMFIVDTNNKQIEDSIVKHNIN